MVSNENFEDVMKALGKSHTLSAQKSMHFAGVEIGTLACSSSEKERLGCLKCVFEWLRRA